MEIDQIWTSFLIKYPHLEQQLPHPGHVVGAGVLKQVRVDDARVQRVGLHRHIVHLELQVDVLGEQDLGQLALVVRVRGVVIFAAIKKGEVESGGWLLPGT